MDCICTTPGYCPVLKTNMVGRRFEICQGGVLTPELCERYRQKWLAEASHPVPPPTDLSCVHRGDELEPVQCQSCSGKVLIKTFVCAIHGQCSIQKDVGKRVCAVCSERSPPPLI